MKITIRFLFAATVGFCVFIFSGCRDESITDKGPFAVDIGDSTLPYLVVDTKGGEIQFEPKIDATLQVFENKTLMQEVPIGIEYRGKPSFRLSDKKGFNIERSRNVEVERSRNFKPLRLRRLKKIIIASLFFLRRGQAKIVNPKSKIE